MSVVMSAQPDPGLVEAALEYARRARPVFPCGHDKRPLTPHGFQDATTEPAQIREWWRRWPDALIGMPTGRASGVVVIDCDVREGLDGCDAYENLAAPYGGVPHTVMALTPSGGIHFYYQCPDAEVRNSASRLAPGVDVRGEGGYVIVPPSRLPDGRCYEWEASNPPKPGPMPAWLLRSAGTHTKPEPVAAPVDGKVVSGQRNAYLASYAGRMARAGFDRLQIMQAVRAENARICNPPLDESELARTIGKSADRWVSRAAEDGVRPVGVPDAVEGGERRRRFEALSVADMLLQPFPRWRIRDLIPERGLCMLWGAPGSGKTFLALDMACAIARGIPWLGRRVRPGLVVYWAAEGHLRVRLDAYMRAHEVGPDDLRRLRVVQAAGDLLDAGQLEEFVAMLRELDETVAQVVVDTTNRAMPGADENSPEDMGALIAACKQIEEVTGCHVLLVHHSGKDAARGSRGHSSLHGAVDAELSVRKDGSVRTLSAEKVRDGDTGPVAVLKLAVVDLGAARDHDPDAEPDERITSCVVEHLPDAAAPNVPTLTDRERTVLAAFHEAITGHAIRVPPEAWRVPGNRLRTGQNGVSHDVVRDVVRSRGGLTGQDGRDSDGTERKAFHRAVRGLVAKQILQLWQGVMWLVVEDDE